MANQKHRVSRHNGRAGKNGVYNPKHNDRSFDLSHAENINPEMTLLNQYWDWKYGLRSHDEQMKAGPSHAFEVTEKEFYTEQYGGYIAGQAQRNAKAGHHDRNRSVEDILGDKRYCPEETLYQIGKDGDCPDPEVLMAITTEFMAWFDESFGSNVKILDWALHLDETSPHIHARQTFFCINRYGEVEPKQEKALEALGIPLKDPDKKPGKTNNRKVKFDEICRDKLLEICQQHGLEIETEAIYGGKVYLEKQDYIIESQRLKLLEQADEFERLQSEKAKQDTELQQLERESAEMKRQLAQMSMTVAEQKEQLAMQAEALEMITGDLDEKRTLLSDANLVLDQISGKAYDLAVEDITEKAVAETQKADRILINNQMKIIADDPHLRKGEKTLLTDWLTVCKNKLREGAQIVLDRVRLALGSPDQRRESMAKIKEAIRPSVRALIHKLAEQSHQSRTGKEGKDHVR